MSQSQNNYEFLDINNIKAGFNSAGDMFTGDTSMANDEFEAPKGSGLGMLNIGNVWISGIEDNGGGLYLAASTYNLNGDDFWYGPIADNYNPIILPGIVDSTYDSLYNHVWKISKDEIDYHINNFNNGGYVMPWSIASWPANGDVTNGIAPILAPFVDVNSNGVYEPLSGDYPKILGDQALYIMFNDDRELHTESGAGSLKLGFEFHAMVYAFDNPVDKDLYNTVFLNYTVHNRSPYSYSGVRFGLWFDLCVGCFQDNFVGCDTMLNSFFVYNGNPTDPDCSFGPGYGNFPPAQGVTLLNQEMTGFGKYENNFSVTGNPENYFDYNNYLHSSFKDGTPFKDDCDYYGGIMPTAFQYHDDPNDSSGISEYTCGNLTGHLTPRAYMVTGPFTLRSGEKLCIDVAFPFAQDSLGTHLSSVAMLKNRTQNIQAYYNAGQIGCSALSTGTSITESLSVDLRIIPNPTGNYLSIQNFTGISSDIVEIFDLSGKLLLKQNWSSRIDVSNISRGIYNLRLTTKNFTHHSRFMKI